MADPGELGELPDALRPQTPHREPERRSDVRGGARCAMPVPGEDIRLHGPGAGHPLRHSGRRGEQRIFGRAAERPAASDAQRNARKRGDEPAGNRPAEQRPAGERQTGGCGQLPLDRGNHQPAGPEVRGDSPQTGSELPCTLRCGTRPDAVGELRLGQGGRVVGHRTRAGSTPLRLRL